jgi:SAM-dependent methyltransferase
LLATANKRLNRLKKGDVMKAKNLTPKYGNWVSKKMFYILACGTIIMILLVVCIPVALLKILFLILAILGGCFFRYFLKAYCVFSYNGGGLAEKIHELILTYLQWNGNGQILDIGCGSGALAIKLSKKYPNAKITGIDYWGKEWDYAKKQCEQNAKLEGVSDKINFIKGSASTLPFEDQSFDVVVSNFTFHEVKDSKNKIDVIKEALRVVKKDGAFVFHDLFFDEKIYGDKEKMLEELRAMGLSAITMERTSDLEIIPRFLRTSFMLGGIGIIYGKKC